MKQLKIINASITKQQALEILDQNNLKAAYYKVPQGDNKELAEAMRLLSGLGHIILNSSDNRLVGSFLNPVSVSTGSNPEDRMAGDNIIQLFFEDLNQESSTRKPQS